MAQGGNRTAQDCARELNAVIGVLTAKTSPPESVIASAEGGSGNRVVPSGEESGQLSALRARVEKAARMLDSARGLIGPFAGDVILALTGESTLTSDTPTPAPVASAEMLAERLIAAFETEESRAQLHVRSIAFSDAGRIVTEGLAAMKGGG